MYSADRSKLEMYWTGFDDPESSISGYRIAVGRGVYNPNTQETAVEPQAFATFRDEPADVVLPWVRTTYFFRDGTIVIGSVAAVNKAGLGTVASANGFIIDT